MMNLMARLLIGLVLILLSCELFTNSIEWLGKKLKLGDGVIGSIFSAVGTCLPETAVPVIALLSGKDVKDSVDICTGAIMGAPFMLSTLAFFITGGSVIFFMRKRKSQRTMTVNHNILKRDLKFFFVVYGLGITAGILENVMLKSMMALLLILLYIYYIIITVKQDLRTHSDPEILFFSRVMHVSNPNLALILVQLLVSLGGIVYGAHVFVQNIESISQMMGISALVLALVITPIATELPEKFNSILWIRKNKDTLAMGNITGAMVFQSCIPVSIGMLSTPWRLDPLLLLSSMLAILSAGVVYLWVVLKNRLQPLPLLAGGGFYLLFIGYLLSSIAGW